MLQKALFCGKNMQWFTSEEQVGNFFVIFNPVGERENKNNAKVWNDSVFEKNS